VTTANGGFCVTYTIQNERCSLKVMQVNQKAAWFGLFNPSRT